MANKSTGRLGYSCLLLFVCALFLVYKYVLQVSPSIITQQLMSAYGLSGAGLGVLAGAYFYTYMLMQIPAGMLMDEYSVKNLTAAAIGVCALGAFFFYRANHYGSACLARGLVGFGAAFATVSYMKMASIWFEPRQFSLLSGFFGTACMGGAGCAELLTSWTTQSYGWHNMLLYSAIIGLVLFIVFLMVGRDKPVDHVAEGTTPKGVMHSLKETLKNKNNYPLILYSGFSFIPAAVFGGLWGVPFLEQVYHMSHTSAATSASLVFFGFAISGPIFGLWSDRIGRRKPFIISGTVIAWCFLFVVLYVPHLSHLVLNTCIFLFGLANGVFLVSYTMGKESNPLAITATVIAVINTGDALCGGIMEPLVGKLLDHGWDGKMVAHARVFSTHDYHMAMSVLSLSVFLAIVSACFTKESHPAATQCV